MSDKKSKKDLRQTLKKGNPHGPDRVVGGLPQWGNLQPGKLPKGHPMLKEQARQRAKVKAKELERASQAPPAEASQYKTGEVVRITGGGKVNETLEDGRRVSTDHHGALGQVETTYTDPKGRRFQMVRTEDGQLRGVNQHSLERANSRISTTVPRSAYIPTFITVAMNNDYCGERCNEMKHCLDDHYANGDPDAQE